MSIRDVLQSNVQRFALTGRIVCCPAFYPFSGNMRSVTDLAVKQSNTLGLHSTMCLQFCLYCHNFE
jgi:hypothetical protein